MTTFDVIGAQQLDTPLVVSVPHAGTWVPPEDAALVVPEGDALLRDADAFVDRLCQDVPACGAALLRARVSRYVLDVNRAPDDVDREVCADLPNTARPSVRGLVWRSTTDGAPVLRRPLTLGELESRITRIHRPYHGALATLLEERRSRFGFALLLDVHSMPSSGRAAHNDAGARRADVVPGDLRGSSCAPALSKLVNEHFRARGFAVRPNDPYMGGYITRHHGRPSESVHAIQLELNRDLYMDEDALIFDSARAHTLIPHVLELVKSMARFVP